MKRTSISKDLIKVITTSHIPGVYFIFIFHHFEGIKYFEVDRKLLFDQFLISYKYLEPSVY